MKPSHQLYSKTIKKRAKEMRNNPTPAEYKLWCAIRNSQLGVKFRRQQQFENKYIADFVSFQPKIIIEVDGSQHLDAEYDLARNNYFEENHFIVLRYWNADIIKNIEGVLLDIKKAIDYMENK